jgi:Tol biopolymer transport system component
MHPRLSPDGKYAVFVGAVLGVTDVYRIDLATQKAEKITHDAYSEKDPALSGDNSQVVYASNLNAQGNIESAEYHLYALRSENEAGAAADERRRETNFATVL